MSGRMDQGAPAPLSRYRVAPSGKVNAQRWALFDGPHMVRTYTDKHVAEARAHNLELKAVKAAQMRKRPCLTCGTVFASEGPHNRMCKGCRARANDTGMI